MALLTEQKGQMGTAQPRSLWRYLWAWALGAVIALWMLLAGLSYSTGYHEAEEISDGLLVSAAQILLAQPDAGPARIPEGQGPVHVPPAQTTALPAALSEHPSNAYAPDLHVLIWQEDRLVWDSHSMHGHLPLNMALGHQTLRITVQGETQEWRGYVAESQTALLSATGGDAKSGSTSVRRVAVFLDPARREALAADIAEHILLPALLFLPMVALILASAVRRGLLPLQQLSSKISALDVDAGQSLVPQQPYQELGVTVQAINHLVQRLQEQIARERRFAADVAHELRTPLTALVLQARLARDAALPSDQGKALQAVEQAGQALIEQLPDGVLRRSAEQRLTVAPQANDSHQESIAAAVPPSTLAEQALPTARQRLERRVLQLAIHAPQCLFMLTSLPLRDGACRAAFDWVENTAMTVPAEQLPEALLRLVPQISGATGALLAQAIAPGADIIRLLHSQPEAEFEALANALDPDPRLPE